MRIGLLADIHESVEYLDLALQRLARESVDRVIVLGDIFETGQRIDDTVMLLNAAGATGVWGNHDIGLCWDIDDETRSRYSPVVLEFAARLRSRLRIDDLLFQHVEPWLDASRIEDLWYFEGHPTSADQIRRGFAAGDHRVSFHGHYHRWLIGTDDGILPWSGECGVELNPARRYLVVIHAVCQGHCAIFDSRTHWLEPLRLGGPDQTFGSYNSFDGTRSANA